MNSNRKTLKEYFVKGAIPTEVNFAELIDSMLIQGQDNILKLPNDPLRISASGADENLLNFCRVEQGQPIPITIWQIKQKPAGKPGLSIGDATASRLFIESGTGNVGIGTTTPSVALDIAGQGTIHLAGNPHPSTPAQGAYIGWNALTGGTGETDFINNQGKGSGGFAFMNTPENGSPQNLLMFITGTGNVGIGTSTTTPPAAKLDVGSKVLLQSVDGYNFFKDIEKSDGKGLRVGTAWGMYGIYAETGAGVLGGAEGVNLQHDAVTVDQSGHNVHIRENLEVSGNITIGGKHLVEIHRYTNGGSGPSLYGPPGQFSGFTDHGVVFYAFGK